jgi:Flp pilus assembly protein TadD
MIGLLVAQSRDVTGFRLRYRQIAGAALASGNFETARVACLRGLSLSGDERTRLEWLYCLSVALNGLGHRTEAAALLANAAPLDHPGCIQAHLAAAQSLLNAAHLTPEVIGAAEKHLRNALALDPQSLEIKEAIGRFCINTHQPAKARQELLEVYPSKQETALLLAIVADGSRDTAEARTWMDAAVSTFRRNLKEISPRDSQKDRLSLARALQMEQNFQEAAQVLDAGLAVNEQPAYRRALGEVCALWAAKLAASDHASPLEQLRVIQRGLAAAPRQWQLALELIHISHDRGAAGVEARTLVQERLEDSAKDVAAWWHFLLATDARQTGDPAGARSQVETAYGLAPEIPEIANDMAMDLALGQPPDLQRALAIIESAAKQFPDNANLRDTRGKILHLLGRGADVSSASPM